MENIEGLTSEEIAKKFIGKELIYVEPSENDTFDYITHQFIYDDDYDYELYKTKIIHKSIFDMSDKDFRDETL